MNIKKIFASYWIRSAFFSFLQRFSLIFFGFINLYLLIRILTVKEMGIWAIFLTTITIFENTKTALLKIAHIKFVAESFDNNEKATIASSSLLINGSITLLALLVILIAGKSISVFFHSGQELYSLFVWFIPGLISMIFFSHMEAIQNSHFDFKGTFAGNLIRQAFFFILIASHYFLQQKPTLQLLAMFLSASILCGTIVLFFYTKKYLQLRFNPGFSWIKKIINYGGYIFGSGVVSNIYSNADQIIIAFIVPESVAFYNAAKRINGFIDMPTYTAGDILFPKLSLASAETGIKKITYLFEKMVAALFLLIIPVAIVVIILAKQIIIIIAGKEYISSVHILRVYMIISVLGILQHQASTTLYSIGKSKLCFFVSTISLGFNLSLSFVCLNLIGFYGAAISSLITSFLTFIVWLIIAKKQIGFTFSNILVYSREFIQIAFNKTKSIATSVFHLRKQTQ